MRHTAEATAARAAAMRIYESLVSGHAQLGGSTSSVSEAR
jgi:hypothetical protein